MFELRDEQLRQMLGGVAHEIRNPLGGIELYAGFIADDLDKNDSRREHILKVIAEVRNLNQVISDFLAFARPLTFEMDKIVLDDVVSDALNWSRVPFTKPAHVPMAHLSKSIVVRCPKIW